MLPQPTQGTPSTDALSKLMQRPGTGLWMGEPPSQEATVTGDGPQPIAGVHLPNGEMVGTGDGPRAGVYRSSPSEGVAPTAPAMTTSPIEGVMTNRDPGPAQPGQPAPTPPAPGQPPVSPYGLGGMARRGRRHMMQGGGGMSGTPALAGLHALINGFGQGGY